MGGKKNIKVTKESPSGLNQRFYDPSRGKEMPRGEFVREIKQGQHPGYHVMKKPGPDGRMRNIPRSNPDRSEGNNLG